MQFLQYVSVFSGQPTNPPAPKQLLFILSTTYKIVQAKLITRSAMKAQDPIVQTNTVLHKIGVRAWCKYILLDVSVR